MGIPYSGNASITQYTTGSSQSSVDAETAIITALTAAGWSNTKNAATATLTFTGQPLNNSTVVIANGQTGQTTYTFKSALTPAAFEVLIDAGGLASTISNLVNAIIAGPGGGTKYGNGGGYAASTLVTAVATSGTIMTITYVTTGSTGNGVALSQTGTTNATWSNSNAMAGGGNTLLSVITPQGLQLSLFLNTTVGAPYVVANNAGLTFNPGDRTRTRIYGFPSLCGGAAAAVVRPSTTFKIICNSYQMFHFILGSAATNFQGNGLACGTPFIPSNLQAPTATAMTGNGVSPIQVTLPAHGFVNGQQVLIVGAIGNTAANGVFTITFIDANNFSLNGSTGNGTYSANTAYVSNTTTNSTINEAIWACGTSAGAPANIRSANLTNQSNFQTVNSFSVTEDGDNGAWQIYFHASEEVQWLDGSFLLSFATMRWATGGGGIPKLIGLMWDAVVVKTNTIPLDQTATFDSPAHNFWTINDSTGGGNVHMVLLVATS